MSFDDLRKHCTLIAESWREADDMAVITAKAVLAALDELEVARAVVEAARNSPWCVDPFLGPPMKPCGTCDSCQLAAKIEAYDKARGKGEA